MVRQKILRGQQYYHHNAILVQAPISAKVVLAINAAYTLEIATLGAVRVKIGFALGHRELTVTLGARRSGGDRTHAAVGAEQHNAAVRPNIDLLVVVRKKTGGYGMDQYTGKLAVLANGAGELNCPLLRYPAQYRLADEQTVDVGVVTVNTEVLTVAQVHWLGFRSEIGIHQPAFLVNRRKLRNEAAVGLQLSPEVAVEVGMLKHVLAHIQQNDIHQPDHAVHMRFKGCRQVHRIISRSTFGQGAFMLDLTQNEDPHGHQRKKQYGAC